MDRYRPLLNSLRYKLGGRLQALARKGRAAYYRLFYPVGQDVYIAAGCRLEGKVIAIGNRVTLDTGTILVGPVSLGSDIYINRYCVISAATLGDNVLLGYGVQIFGDSRDVSDNPNCRGAGSIMLPVEIGRGTFVGANVTIQPGVKIGEGVVIAPGATVTSDCEANSVYGGIPAKKLSDLPQHYPVPKKEDFILQAAIGPTDVVIVYPDLLGDYLLMRNHLRYLREQVNLQGRKICYIGNAATRPLIEVIDADIADSFRWLENYDVLNCTLKKWIASPLKKPQWRAVLDAMDIPETVGEIWCPSTGPWVVNALPLSTKASRKLGKDMESLDLKLLQRRVYTEIFTPSDFRLFNFDQHRQFFTQATGQSFDAVKLDFPKEILLGRYTRQPLNKPYCVVFPDSAEDFKQWPPRQFAAVINTILAETDLTVYVCGHKSKRYLGQEILKHVKNDRAINLMGETNLVEVFDVIGQSEFVLCNDSFALHAANAMARPVFCVTQGLYMGRYLPYPPKYRQANHTYLFPTDNSGKLNDILPETVWQAIKSQIGQ